MNLKFFLPLFVFFTFASVLLSQSFDNDTLEIINRDYFGNHDYYFASNSIWRLKKSEYRHLLIKATQSFEKTNQWEGFLKANTDLIKTYKDSLNYLEIRSLHVLIPPFFV